MENNLSALNDEERNLLHLRQQLQKIKRVREEQAKKDQYISSLKERISVLETERGLERQHCNELHGIMSDRIVALERYLCEKETIEQQYMKKVEDLTAIIDQKASNEERLKLEDLRYQELRLLYEKSLEDSNTLRSQLNSEKVLHDHFQTLFESLREELSYKDKLYEDLRNKERIVEEELIRERLINEELNSKLRLSEDRSKHQEITMAKLRSDMENGQLEISRVLHENERLLAVIKTGEEMIESLRLHIHTIEFSTNCEKNENSKEIASLKLNNDALMMELQQIRKSIAHFSKSLKILDTLNSDGDIDCESPISEICGVVKSMRRLLNDLEGCELNVVVSYLCRYIYFSVDPLDLVSKKTNKTETTVFTDKLDRSFADLEEKMKSVWADVVAIDNVLIALRDSLKQANVIPDVELATISTYTDFSSKRRKNLVSLLVAGVRNALDLVERFRSQGNVPQLFMSCQEELKILQEKYHKDVGQLQRISDEALFAIKVNNMESSKSLELQRRDFERKLFEQQQSYDACIGKSINPDLKDFRDEFERLLIAFTLLVVQLNRSKENLQQLKEAYKLTAKFAHGYSVLVNDINILAQLCEQPPPTLINSQSLVYNRTSKSSSGRNLRTVVILVVAVNRFKYMAKEMKYISGQRHIDLIKGYALNRQSINDGYLSLLTDIHQLTLCSRDWNLPDLEEMRCESLPVMIQRVLSSICVNDKLNDVNFTTKNIVSDGKFSLPCHIRKSLTNRSILSILVPTTNLKFAGDSLNVVNNRELFGQRALNFIHKFILEAQTDKDELKTKLIVLQRSLQKVQSDMVLCKEVLSSRLSNDGTAVVPISPAKHTDDKSYECSEFHPSVTTKFDDSREISHISHDSLSSWRTLAVDQGSDFIDDGIRRPLNLDNLKRSTVQDVIPSDNIFDSSDVDTSRITLLKSKHRYSTDNDVSHRNRFQPLPTSNERKDRDLLDIYNDIGQLTSKLESRIQGTAHRSGSMLVVGLKK